MTHLPRARIPIWPVVLMGLGYLAVLIILGWTAVSLIRQPPIPPPSYPGRDAANPWAGK